MFFFIPIRTDAPIYHWPFATVGLVVLNILAFLATGLGSGPLMDDWALAFGDGLHPLQWVTANFVHFDPFHLVGNMLFLWTAGLIVEGKLGWRRFLSVYLGIGICGTFLIQLAMLGHDGPVAGLGGASLVVYGLLAIALVWAPRNEVDVWYFVWLLFYARVGLWEVSVLRLGMLFLGMQILFAIVAAVLTGSAMSSEAAHLVGAVLGLVVGVVFLKRGVVDCENWDLFAVLSKTHGRRPEPEYDSLGRLIEPVRSGRHSNRRAFDFADAPAPARDPKQARRRFRELLAAGKPRAALNEFLDGQRTAPDWTLSELELTALIDGLYAKRLFDDALPLLEEYVARFPDDCPAMRLRLAAVLVEVERRPQAALRVLRGIPPGTLPEKAEARRRRIEETAARLVEEGVIELADPRRNV
ncbi:MAG: rhomboid family intramembrane serine protease [Planctomycetales bacterium]